MSEQLKRVFIGGLGRSGTTIMLNAFYRHAQLYAMPIETKFIVEADGFYDLYQALTTDYSTALTPLAIERFIHLMREMVTGRVPSPFRDQQKLFPAYCEHYFTAVDELHAALIQSGCYPEASDVILMMRRFIEITFDNVAVISNKQGWVEKTPANIWRLPFLRELYPECYFVHMIRDPRYVLASMVEKGWMDADASMVSYRATLLKLLEIRRRYANDPRFVEIRLEDLVADTAGTLQGMASAIGMLPFTDEACSQVAATMARYSNDKASTSGRVKLSPTKAAAANAVLSSAIIELGYPAEWPDELLEQ